METTPSTSKLCHAVPAFVKSSNVRVLGKTYKIQPLPDHAPDGEFGACNYAFQLIEYNSKLGTDELKDTILHEMVHCLDHGMQLKMSEEQVHAISTGFYSLIKDNKEFFEWVISDADV
jgi:hypothetical protein